MTPGHRLYLWLYGDASVAKLSRATNQDTGIKSSKSNFFSVFSFQLSKLMTVNALLRMADTAMHGQAISIGSGQWSHSRENSGANPVSVDTCAVPRETHPPACLPADLARLTCQQVTRSSNA